MDMNQFNISGLPEFYRGIIYGTGFSAGLGLVCLVVSQVGPTLLRRLCVSNMVTVVQLTGTNMDMDM